MEAMIVPSAPVANTSKATAKTSKTQSGAESSFAPTLDKAVNQKNTSSRTPQENAKTSKSGNNSEPHSGSDLDSLTSVDNHGANQTPSAQQAESPGATKQQQDAIDQSAASSQQASWSLESAKVEVHGIVHSHRFYSTGLSLSETKRFSAVNSTFVNNFSSAENSVSSPNGQLNGQLFNSFNTMEEQTVSLESLRGASEVLMQKNDSITWSHQQNNDSHLLQQSQSKLQLISKDGTVENTFIWARNSAFSKEQIANSKNIATNINVDFAEKTSPLSLEKIAANVVGLSANDAQAGRGLREGNFTLRQETQGQFIAAKLERIDPQQNGATQQNLNNGDSETSDKNQLANSLKTVERATENSFTQTLQTATNDKSSHQVFDTPRPGSTQFIFQAHETSVLHQVVQKFRLSQTLHDSKLVMKLHPAELGDLKIDIQLKDGTINANILAQSRQVQDILEKNMPRLKELMEAQGITVNEIAVSLDTDVSDNKNMFDDHLAQDENSFTKGGNTSPSQPFILQSDEEEDVVTGLQTDQSGVNVTI